MNTRIFSLTETIATLGVIGSLLFVGFQIQQGNQFARMELLYNGAAIWTEGATSMAGNEYLSGLMYRSFTDSASDFEGAEGVSLYTLILGHTKNWEAFYRTTTIGVLGTEDVIFPDKNSPYWSSQYQRDIWQRIRPNLAEDFATFWEQRFNLAEP
jgi:hypothetical protein